MKQTVAEIMKTELWTITPDTSVASAYRQAAAENIRYQLVLANGVLAGVVSAGALARALGTTRAEVRHVMSSPVLCIAPTTTVAEALQIMEEQHVSFLPVITGTFLVGFVDLQVLGASPGRLPVGDVEREAPSPN